jgi:hypothetical protein
MISTEKLKAKAKATVSQMDSLLVMEIIIMIKQKRLTTTVKAFFSDRYFFIRLVLLATCFNRQQKYYSLG